MALQIEDLEDQTKYKEIMSISYSDLIDFILDYLKKRSGLIFLFWSLCIIFLVIAINVRINIAGYFPHFKILSHSILGSIVLPILCIPLHELLHIIPYYISGARNIRVGMDLRQYLFYVSAHRYVASPLQFKVVALIPFLIISVICTLFIFILPGLWKWSFSLFLFFHTTMCAGDFALLNFYFLNRGKKIYTWDDVDKKEAYFFEEL